MSDSALEVVWSSDDQFLWRRGFELRARYRWLGDENRPMRSLPQCPFPRALPWSERPKRVRMKLADLWTLLDRFPSDIEVVFGSPDGPDYGWLDLFEPGEERRFGTVDNDGLDLRP